MMAIMMAVSCGPSRFAMNVELAGTSKSGVELVGKNISVSYVQTEKRAELLASAANSFTTALESDYFGGEQAIGIFSVEASEDASSKESMLDLLMETGVDVAFLFDMTSSELLLYTYDAMNVADTVQIFHGKINLNNSLTYQTYGTKLGEKCAESFAPTWTKTKFTFYCYSGSTWDQATQYVYAYKFKEAINIWMEFATSKNNVKRSVAAYNIAAALTILGQKSLATKWLDLSDSSYLLPDSASLRTRLY